jgi:acetyl-CoA C-acetyltransferase
MYIKGVGMTKFDYSQKPWWELAYIAGIEALQDANMKASDLDAIVFSGMSSASGGEHQTHKTSLLSDLFKVNIPIIETPSVCAGGGVAFWTANHLSGFRNILVIASEHLVESKSEVTVDYILSAAEKVIEQREGLIFPAQNALVWSEYAQKYNIDDSILSLVALKNHNNAFKNPLAYYYKRPMTLEQIENSPMVASPLKAFHCSLSVNGGAAVIISQDKSDVQVVGSGYSTDYILTYGRKEVWHFPATQRAAEIAYKEAGIKPEQISVAEVHDAFESVEVFSYEDLGFAKPGKAPELIKNGYFNIDGNLPTNPSGGLKAKGHPISATGLAQIYEITKQLRGQAGDRQIKKDLQYGLTHNIGGAGGSVTVHIFKKV